MKVIAKLNNVRHSPFKMRVVVNAVKDLSIAEARTRLRLSPKKAARYVLKTLNSAVANAVNNFNLDESKLKIEEMQVGEGRRYKKPRYRARGRLNILKSRYSNLRVVLTDGEDEVVDVKKSEKKADKKEEKKTKAKEVKDADKKEKKEDKKESEKDEKKDEKKKETKSKVKEEKK